MKKEWSRAWVKSVQPRKQRKYRHRAPLHVRHKFISSNLAPDLRRRFKKRSMPLRKGDEIEVMKGSSKGQRGTVSRVNLKKSKVFVEEIKIKKVDGSEIMKPLEPSNLRILKLALDDKMRQNVVDRAEPKPKKKARDEPEKPPKPHKAPEHKKKEPKEKKVERKEKKVKKPEKKKVKKKETRKKIKR